MKYACRRSAVTILAVAILAAGGRAEKSTDPSPCTAPAATGLGGTLPETLLTAVKSLFEDGPAPMADPRGKEYRAVTIRVSEGEWCAATEITTHGWVIDPAVLNPQVICWNGLVYPVLKLGGRADLQADVEALVQMVHEENTRFRQNRRSVFHFVSSYVSSYDWYERLVVDYDYLTITHAAILTRLGQVKLAQQTWDACCASAQMSFDPAVQRDDLPTDERMDPYEGLMYDYAWNLGRRAQATFARGEDAAASRDVHACAAVLTTARAVLAKRRPLEDTTVNYYSLYWMGVESPPMLQELERRAKEPPYDPVLLHPEKYRDKQARIAALIRDLELVGNQPRGCTGALQITAPVMQELLLAEGDDIAEPLLTCVEHDTRLTRSPTIGAGPSGMRLPTISCDPVAEIARQVLVELKVLDRAASYPPANDTVSITERHKLTIAEFRGKREERMAALADVPAWQKPYAILADDRAGLQAWVAAADQIVGRQAAGQSKSNAELKANQDRLRKIGTEGYGASVRALMMERLNGTFDRDQNEAYERLREDCELWGGPIKPTEENCGVPLHSRLGEQGNPDSVEKYIGVLKTASRKGTEPYDEFLGMLWQFPDSPALQEAAEWAFNGENSPWNPLLPAKEIERVVSTSGKEADRVAPLFSSQLLSLPAFRRQVLRLLDNTEEVGQATGDSNDSFQFEPKPGWPTVSSRYIDAEACTRLGNRPVPVRACDVVARLLVGRFSTRGVPRLEFQWEKSRRDQAVAACKDFLQRCGERFKDGAAVRTAWDPEAHLRFPSLSSAATPAQVARGEAIFTLAGEGEAYAIKMDFPAHGRWFTNKELQEIGYSGDTENVDTPRYDNEGEIWQAEELIKGGKAQRFFGFVWSGGMHRVPAEEVDILAPDHRFVHPQWHELSGGVDAKLAAPGLRVTEDHFWNIGQPVGRPLPVTLELRNRRGVPQAVDGELLQRSSNGTVRLREGVTIHVWKARPGAPMNYVWDASLMPDFIVLAPRMAIEHFVSKQRDLAKLTRQPTEVFTAFSIDLRDLFDLSQPGYYAVWVTFDERVAPFVGTTPRVPFTLIAPTK